MRPLTVGVLLGGGVAASAAAGVAGATTTAGVPALSEARSCEGAQQWRRPQPSGKLFAKSKRRRRSLSSQLPRSTPLSTRQWTAARLRGGAVGEARGEGLVGSSASVCRATATTHEEEPDETTDQALAHRSVPDTACATLPNGETDALRDAVFLTGGGGGGATSSRLPAVLRSLGGWGLVTAAFTFSTFKGEGAAGLGAVELSVFVTAILTASIYFGSGLFVGLGFSPLSKPLTNSSSSERGADSAAPPPGFLRFRNAYLVVHLLATLADFMMGPYLYRLYSEKGLEMKEIGLLFTAGFVCAGLASMGIGAVVDKFGRRNGCLASCFLHALQCMMLRAGNYRVLLLGRAISGVASALFATSYECWMVDEHHKRGFPSGLMGRTFSQYVQGMGLVAVCAGQLSGLGVDKGWGIHAPFDLSAAAGVCVAGLLMLLWTENYGTSQALTRKSGGVTAAVRDAWGNILLACKQISSNTKTLCVGLYQSLFESAMLTFVFMWTPVLDAASQAEAVSRGVPFTGIHHATIFTGFMIAVMGGSTAFGFLTEALPSRWRLQPEKVLLLVGLLGMGAMYAVASSHTPAVLMTALLLFEGCVGMYFPAIGTMRSRYIEDSVRGTVMNLFRVVLNAVVVAMLTGPIGSGWELSVQQPVVFGICTAMMAGAVLVQIGLLRSGGGGSSGSRGGGGDVSSDTAGAGSSPPPDSGTPHAPLPPLLEPAPPSPSSPSSSSTTSSSSSSFPSSSSSPPHPQPKAKPRVVAKYAKRAVGAVAVCASVVSAKALL